MTDWLERIDRTTGGGILAEHIARYLFARPVVAGASCWVDLGCGNGVGARRAADADPRPARTVLVDIDEGALEAAAGELGGESVETLRSDLGAADGVAAVADALASLAGDAPCVTCFETIEHLVSFSPLLSWLIDLAENGGATIVVSVPNDAASAVENPYHETIWGEDALRELRDLLPPDHIVVRQIPLAGSTLAVEYPVASEAEVDVDTELQPSHFLIAFGARLGELRTVTRIEPADLGAQRAWERQREADLAYFRQRVEELEAPTDLAAG